jgi:hypothetical protein
MMTSHSGFEAAIMCVVEKLLTVKIRVAIVTGFSNDRENIVCWDREKCGEVKSLMVFT